MSWDKHTILGELAESKGYEVALFTTFNFEVRFFEQQVFPLLAGNEIKIVNLFIDSKELNKAISNTSSRILGREYFVTPILMNGSFHPKVILLLGKKKAKLIVSSANIKTSGYIFNNEVYNVFEYSEDDNSYANVFASAIEFFKQLCNEGKNVDSEVKGRLANYSIPKGDNTDVSLLFNIEEPFIKQLKKLIHDKVEKINIAVPFYDAHLEAVKDLRKEFECDDIELYVQNKKSTFPYEYNISNKIIEKNSVHLFSVVSDRKDSGSFYHGKVIEFVTDNNSYILYGSANCSISALSRSKKQNGNIECIIVAKGLINANKEFFDKFVTAEEEEFQAGFDFETEEITPEFSFIFGESDSDGNQIKLYLSYQSIKNIEVYYRETKLDSAYVSGMIEVSLPFDVFDGSFSVFEITVKYNGSLYIIPVWFNDVNRLNYYRFSDKTIEVPYISNNVDLTEYMPYIKPVAQALFDKAWYKVADENKEAKEMKKANPDDEDEEDINSDFILKEDIQGNYIEKKYLTSVYRNVQVLAGRYYSLITGKHQYNSEKTETPTEIKYPKPASKREEANPAEKWLGRFYKRNIKVMLNPDNRKTKSYIEYRYMFGTILDNIQLIFYNQRKEGFLDHRYVMDVKKDYVTLMLDKAKAENKYDDMEFLISFVLLTVVERCRYVSPQDEEAKRLFNRITSMVDIRESFQDYLNKEKLTSILVTDKDTYTDEDIEKEIDELMAFSLVKLDSLFEYMTWNQLESHFKKRYGSGAELTISGNEIELYVLQSSDKFRLDMSLPNKDIVETEAYIEGYGRPISKKRYVFRCMGENKKIEFLKKGNKLIRTLYNGKNKVSFYCKKNDNGAWSIDYNRRIKE